MRAVLVERKIGLTRADIAALKNAALLASVREGRRISMGELLRREVPAILRRVAHEQR